MKRTVIMVCVGLVVLSISAQAGHLQMRASEFTPNEPQAGYGTDRIGFTSAMNLGDLTFNAPYPSALQLTPAEKFIIAGGTHPQTLRRTKAWYDDVLLQCRVAYDANNSVPNILGPEVIAAAGNLDVAIAGGMAYFRNPITGEWPHCKAVSPSPGDLFCRPLTSSEVEHFCKFDGMLNAIVHKGTGPSGGQASVPVQLIGEVWYLRAYGEGGRVIHSGLHYTWHAK